MSRPEEKASGLPRALPGLLVLGLWCLAFPSLDRYHITWDDALGDFFYGERYLSYFLSLDETYLNFRSDPFPEDHRPDLAASPFRGRPWEYYPVANTLAAASSALLWGRLGLIDDPFDAFHAVNLFFAAALVVALFRFVSRRFGNPTAILTLGLLFGSPRMVVHMMVNIKDFPLMVLYSLTALVFFRAFESGSARGLWKMGGLLGLTLATKANALFFPVVPPLLLLLRGIPGPWRGRKKALLAHLLGAGLFSVPVAVAVWPYLWQDPVGRIGEHLRFLLTRKASTSAESVAPAFEAVLFTTPPVFLAAFALGALFSLVELPKRRPEMIFLWAWIASVAGRFLLPQAVNYDGVRHFLELFPPMATIAAFGLVRAATLAARLLPEKVLKHRAALAALGIVFILAPGFYQVARTHPYQLAYWNGLAGGYGGAREANLPQASDYWGLSYRDGLEWLNANAEPGAFLAVPVVEHSVRLAAPERLRPDIRLLPITTPFSPRIEPGRLGKTMQLSLREPVYVMFVERRDWMNVLMADCLQRLEPVAEWTLEGAPVLQIYRYRPPARQP